MVLPGADIRFIAISNGVDSANQQESDFTPFLNIINEWYAKDTSKKIRAVFKAKGESGKPLCTNPPYGYIKDPDDKNHWIVDETAADVVRDIFKMCIAGKGPSQIAKSLFATDNSCPNRSFSRDWYQYPNESVRGCIRLAAKNHIGYSDEKRIFRSHSQFQDEEKVI